MKRLVFPLLQSTAAVLFISAFFITGCRFIGSADSAKENQSTTALAPITAPEVFALAKHSNAKLTLVNVWATWCGPCQEEMPEIAKFKKAYETKGLKVLLVSADTSEDAPAAKKFLQTAGVDFPSYILGQSPGEFLKATKPDWSGGLPATYLLDTKGQILRFWVGKSTYNELDAKVRPLLAP